MALFIPKFRLRRYKMALIRANSGSGGGALEVKATSRTGNPNGAHPQTYAIPSGITEVAVCFTGHTSGGVSGYPTVQWNGVTLTPDDKIVYDYTGLAGVWSVSSVNKYTLDGSGGNLVVTGTDANYDSCCIY